MINNTGGKQQQAW